jgi:hypothetical protein
MKFSRAPAQSGDTREQSGADVRTPHCALRAQNLKTPKVQSSKRHRGLRPLLHFGIWRLAFVICALGAFSSPLAFTSGEPKIGFARALVGRALGFVMRYRSATVAGFHGLPC